MRKNYNGAAMAMPAKEEDLFEEINARTAPRRAEQEAAEREMYLYSDAESEDEELHHLDLGNIAGTIARLLIGCVFVGAVGRGWCEPGFGLAGAMACGAWAVARWRRK